MVKVGEERNINWFIQQCDNVIICIWGFEEIESNVLICNDRINRKPRAMCFGNAFGEGGCPVFRL